MENDMTKMLYAAALSAAALLGTAGVASAQTAPTQPPAAQAQAPQAQATQPPHYEWQYHYAGQSHPEFQGYWALVK
jgi:hypothetical protein